MQIPDVKVVEARTHAMTAYERLVVSDIDAAVKSLSDALAIFGYRVEQVLTAQEAHEQMLAARRAEDDARDFSIIGGGRV